MTSLLALAVLLALALLLVRYARNDGFSTGSLPVDRFRDADGFLVAEIRRLYPR